MQTYQNFQKPHCDYLDPIQPQKTPKKQACQDLFVGSLSGRSKVPFRRCLYYSPIVEVFDPITVKHNLYSNYFKIPAPCMK